MSDVTRELAELTEKIRREAFSAGWRAAVAAIQKAMADAEPDNFADSVTLDSSQESLPFERNRNPPSSGSSGLPAVGTIPHYVLLIVRKRPGLTGADVVSAIHDEGHTFKEPQIRTALARLGKRKTIVNRHGKWFCP